MKKFVILAAAVAAIAACTKSQVVYDDNDVEIGLSPVNYMTTKAGWYGPYSGAEYSDNEQFKVWAQYTSQDAGTQFRENTDDDLADSKYLDEVTFGKKDGTEVWGGTPVKYYWPRTGSLYFAGYSPADDTYVTDADYVFNTGGSKMSLTFTQGDYSYLNSLDAVASNRNYKMVDLMYFDVEPTTTSVSSGTSNVTFKHALSWVSFKVNCKAVCDKLFNIKSIEINDVSCKEIFTSGAGSPWMEPAWTANKESVKSFDIYENTTSDSKAILTSTDYLIVEGLLIIPQTVPTLTIEYEQKASEDQAFVLQNPVTVTISGAETSDNNPETVDNWEINKHYTYTLTLSADEILISPKVDNWELEEMNQVEVPNVTLP